MKHLFTILFFFLSLPIFGQLLKGTIIDKEAGEVAFARIGIKNTSYGTISNGEGKFQLKVNRGWIHFEVSCPGFKTFTDSILIDKELTEITVALEPTSTELEELVITAKTRKKLAHEFMKQVIDRRADWEKAIENYDANLYSFTSIEKQIKDSINRDSILSLKKMNIAEFYAHSFVKNGNQYKDSILATIDLSEKSRTASVSVSMSMPNSTLQPMNAVETNPYLFVNGLGDADINLFKNQLMRPGISQRPLISPLAYNALAYYTFLMDGSFFDEQKREINKIKVIPRFNEEALYSGTLYITTATYELVSADLSINKGALSYFSELHILMDYEGNKDTLLPTRKEFTYLIKEGKNRFNGSIRTKLSNVAIRETNQPTKFWIATPVDHPECQNRDSSFWLTIRPIPLKAAELQFIHEQDSIFNYEHSEAYLKKTDSTYNSLNIWDFTLNGIGHRNTFKKNEWYISPLIQQMILFGVGGYRHRLSGSYEQGFKNDQSISFRPTVDYGFNNKDFKGEMTVGFLYNPRRFSKIEVSGGDVYDFVTNYQSIQGTFSPANRVRNRKFSAGHTFEITNGLYMSNNFFFSYRESIGNISFPKWDTLFGNFTEPIEFEAYKVSLLETTLEYHFRQKFQYRQNKKIIVGTKYPVVSLFYRKGIPKLFGGQSNFDYVELKAHDDIQLGALGNSSWNFIAGAFLHKQNLRPIEHRYFRTSDFFFSNPLYSLQLLDTLLSTDENFIQANYIHHFQGFFLNKIWGINKLKLQETVGGSLLAIPQANFGQIEIYAGLERQFRIKKQIFKIGVYAVSEYNSFQKLNISYKIGFNNFNPFFNKWDY